MTALFKQPLLHFLALGALLFAVFNTVDEGAAEEDPRRVLIDDAAVLEYVQYRNRAFNDRAAAALVAQLSAAEREALIARMVREEVLYREGRRLNLHRDDYVIKQRLVQKMEYLTRGFGAAEGDLDEAAVAAYYEANKARYQEPPAASFTHVFVAGQRAQADALLARLRAERVTFSQATGHGDRFPYHRNYVERSQDVISSHFGADFAAKVLALAADDSKWQGPIASTHGWHLVLVTSTTPGGIPPLANIRTRVEEDARAARLQQASDAAVAEIIAKYQVTLNTSALAANTEDDSRG